MAKAEGASDEARSPEEWAAKTIHYGRPCKGPEGMGRELGLCAFCQALAEDFRVAMAQASAFRDEQWRAAVLAVEKEHFGVLLCHPEAGAKGDPPCAVCPPLRALVGNAAPKETPPK